MNFNDLHLDLAPLCRACRVKSLAVFGSFARGDAGPQSDLDLLVEFAGEDHLFDRMMDLKCGLEAAAGRPVDLLTAGSLRNPVFRRVVSREQIPVWTSAA
jgi:uncharacterized protein